MVSEERKRSPIIPKDPLGNGENLDSIFSPTFKSAAAMAGWDEEALLLATLIVEDTPERDSKFKKRFDLNSPTSSKRKRRAQRSPQVIPVTVLDLDEEETPRKDTGKKKKEKRTCVNGGTKVEERNELTKQSSGVASSSSSSSAALPCIDKLREELSCAICLEICFEPSTTPCGHSFCRKCLRSAADKCGKRCPKCRQLISNGRSCTVNTVLWNTIQLLFPQEVQARKPAANALNSKQHEAQCLSPQTAFYNNLRNNNNRSTQASSVASSRDEEDDAALARRLQREIDGQSHGTRVRNNNHSNSNSNSRNQTPSSRVRTRRGVPPQDEDAALALRLQREEFMQAFRGSQDSSRQQPLSLARANLRALANRAINLRIRDRRT